MDILPLHFRVLHFGGLWWETDKQHWFVKFIWKPLIVSIVLSVALSTLSALAVPNINVNDITKCLFMGITVFALFMKMINFLHKRESMIELLAKFREPICRPQTMEESDILKNNARLIPIVFKCYLCAAYTSATLFLLLPLLDLNEGTANMDFPIETYEICSKDNATYYFITYFFQAFASIITIAMNASLDTILAGFIRLTCGQIDLCCYRFNSERQISALAKIKICAVHHSVIQNIVRYIKSIFMSVVMPFLFLSLITISTSVYNLSQRGITNVESIPFLVYTAAMLMQVFFYCSFGSELMLKGIKISETMYNCDWKELEPTEKKNILFIMFVSQKPLNLSFHGYCKISLNVYVWVLNTSYTAYNILNAMSKDYRGY